MAGEEEREAEAAPGPVRSLVEPGDSPITRGLALAHSGRTCETMSWRSNKEQ